MPKQRAILFLQFTNPAGYPPLERSSTLLSEAGWKITFLGTGALGAEALRFPERPSIREVQIPFVGGGVRQKLLYGLFAARALALAATMGKPVVYASDPLSAPAALLLRRVLGCRVIYHEHDSPEAPAAGTAGVSSHLRARAALAREADLCVLPSAGRLEQFELSTGRHRHGVTIAWNTPLRREVQPGEVSASEAAPVFRLIFHGSIGPARLPFTLAEALALLPEGVILRIVGYETVGSFGHTREFLDRAEKAGARERVEVVGAVPLRAQLQEQALGCNLGLALLPMTTSDVNVRAMAGASNKPFDYLACGLPVLVSDIPEWRAMYVDPGYGVACDPGDPASIAAAIATLAGDPDRARRMGEAGRQRILSDWNYETSFAPVMERLEAMA